MVRIFRKKKALPAPLSFEELIRDILNGKRNHNLVIPYLRRLNMGFDTILKYVHTTHKKRYGNTNNIGLELLEALRQRHTMHRRRTNKNKTQSFK
jgi:hypothetical protein